MAEEQIPMEDGTLIPQSGSHKSKYSQLSDEKRKQYIENATSSRKRRTSNEAATGDHNASSSNVKKSRISWLLKAQSVPYEEQGKKLYKPSCSTQHKVENIGSCMHCGAKKFQYEPPTFCCYKGQVKIATTKVPSELQTLFTSQTNEAQEFRRHIRAYNSIFSFTSFGVNLDKELASARNGVYTFRAQGQIYHHLPSLVPTETNPRYFQLYFYDTDRELQNRMAILRDVDLSEETMQILMEVQQRNPYSQFLRRLEDVPSITDCEIHIKQDIRLDQRVYNAPSADQVAAIWIEGNNQHLPPEREIVVHAHSGHRHQVRHYYGCYDPLQYPLLFPHGEVGWQQNIKRIKNVNEQTDQIGSRHNPATQTSNNPALPSFASIEDIFAEEIEGATEQKSGNVSCREYYCYKFQIRESNPSIVLQARRLLHQFAVDMYIKLETTRLDYYRKKQSEIRTEFYQGIVDSVVSGETRGSQVGKRIVLPASFIGGPRDMRRRYLDAMALVQRFGKPDLFVTMTCNPEWQEIIAELQEGQVPQDRPDLTARVFRAKLQDLRDQFFKKEIFGKVAANVHVIEFQKRGLPHAHMLIILKTDYKITTPDQYDKFVCAEIPNKVTHPTLHAMVIKHMMHGPCGDLNRKNPCMVNGECRNHYPRGFCSTTTHGKDAYPIYRRSDDHQTALVRKSMLDNRWVVPYNPYLLMRYNCHINVEICSGLKAVKYLYKYIYKGHDRVAVHIAVSDGDKMINEIEQFQDARWVSAQEAMWRIFEFNLNEMYPSVINLQLHLPNKQCVSYWKNQDLQNILLWDHVSKTMLTEYFQMNGTNKKALEKKLLYGEFPEYFVWDNKGRLWKERKKGVVIGRINGANPTEGERYYLRLLLNHVRGPTSFEDLLNVGGVQCMSFKESAQKRGLLESDQSTIECLDEASTFQMPQAIRRLFATLLVYCEPTDVRNIWDLHFDSMSEDFRRRHANTLNLQTYSTLKSVEFFLQSMGKNLSNYDLPSLPPNFSDTQDSYPREIRDEMNVQIPDEDLLAPASFNPEQRAAYTIILDRVNTGKSGVFFIDGPGGTGKTYLYRALLAKLRSQGMISLATATSGVAAAIMPGGRTAHSRFKIPIAVTQTSTCNFSKQSANAELIRRSKLIIWDEAPMAKRMAIETVDRCLKDIMDNPEPFGGKVIVFGGDFRQVLPVVPRGTRAETVSASLARSYLWEKMEKIRLTRNMRARTDTAFSQFLLQVGNGDQLTIDEDLIELPNEMVIQHENGKPPEESLIDKIFPNLEHNGNCTDYMKDRAILAATNDCIDMLNERLIARFPGDEKTYHSFDQAVDDTNHYYQEEFLNTLMPNGLPPHKLTLKSNCPIMLLRNLDPSNGMCNGTRMVCRQLGVHVISAEITVGQHAGNKVLIPRIPLSPAENEGYPFQFRRKQFPIRLCFAMTINKAQGQTIPHVGVYLPQHVFSHGQLYVALSRGTSMATTKVLINTESTKRKKPNYTKNVVYKEIFSP